MYTVTAAAASDEVGSFSSMISPPQQQQVDDDDNEVVIPLTEKEEEDMLMINSNELSNPFSFLYNWQPLKITTNYHVGYFESTICRVPLHVFVNVLGFMELPEMVNLLLVNRRWSKVLNDDAVWRQLFTFYGQRSDRRRRRRIRSNNNNNNNNSNSENRGGSNNDRYVTTAGLSIFSREARNELPHMIRNWKDLAIARFKFDKIASFCGANLEFTVDSCGGTMTDASSSKSRQISKVCVIGKASCGKSCLVTRLITGQFQPESIKRTITSNIYSQQVQTTTTTTTTAATLGTIQLSGAGDEQLEQSYEPLVCNMEIIDTAGAERYDRFIPTHLKTANVIVVTFDLSKEDSLDCIVEGGRFYKLVQAELEKNKKTFSPRVVVVGLKSDLKTDNKLSFKALQFCMRHQFPYYECSSKYEDTVKQVNNILAYFALEKARTQQTEEQGKK